MALWPSPRLRARLRALYYEDGDAPRRFRYALLAFDIVTITFFVISSLVDPSTGILIVDGVIALALLVEYLARLSISNQPIRFVFRFTSIMDAIVIVSLFATFLIDNLAFLRVARMLRLLRSHRLTADLKRDSAWFRRNEDVITSAVNLAVFIFVVTAIVLVVEGNRNAQIRNYFDALYFTVATLTTTGFGDITMTDTPGRVLAVLIMIFGVSLFLRLIQVIFRPTKVYFPCPDCGLRRHDPDSVHCKHCGHLLNIPSEGD